MNKVTSVAVRMYSAGTGDFFLLLFKRGTVVTFKLMIDCGCINWEATDARAKVEEFIEDVEFEIDLLIVTHEHADHINGFEKASEQFKKLTIKKVWFAWTEDKTNKIANKYRSEFSKIRMAISKATERVNTELRALQASITDSPNLRRIAESKAYFADTLSTINGLNQLSVSPDSRLTLEDILRKHHVIKKNTKVEFLSPGDLISNLQGAFGVRFFVLGPPHEIEYLNRTERESETYKKREAPSAFNFSFIDALTSNFDTQLPFEPPYLQEVDRVKTAYQTEEWRRIDEDWLFSAGSLALRFERSINNTSLAIAIQFAESGKVLLFPGDAELGSWQSWRDRIKWTVNQEGKRTEITAEELLKNTVFYKAGHHLSQNGTAIYGIDAMNRDELVVMATLDLDRLGAGWNRTMPNDHVGAELIRRTKGNIYFVGDCKRILKNIQTDRVKILKRDFNAVMKCNSKRGNKSYAEHEIAATS